MGRGGLRFAVSLIVSPSYDVINDVIMSDADCTPGRQPCSVAASQTGKIGGDGRYRRERATACHVTGVVLHGWAPAAFVL